MSYTKYQTQQLGLTNLYGSQRNVSKNSLVISLEDLSEIRNKTCNLGQRSNAELHQQKVIMANLQRLELQEKSNQRVKNWPNTLDAIRLNKEN
jgi:hypothetical protein